MPEFCYVAMDARGKESKGKLNVADQDEAIGRLKSMGYFPTRVEPGKPAEPPAHRKKSASSRTNAAHRRKPAPAMHLRIRIPGFGGKVKPRSITAFTRQLARLVDSGLPLLRALRVIERQQQDPILRRAINDAAISIEGGSTFSEALAQHPKIFNHLYVNMVKAGELGGVLDIVLARLAQFMEKAQKIRGKVKAALFYPVAVLIVAAIILGVLMAFVVPKFQLIFNDMLEGRPLPAFTQFVLNISQYVAAHALQTILALGASVMILKFLVRTKRGRIVWDRIALSFPLLGPVLSQVAIARFARSLGTLLSSGVPILQALTIVKETSGNVIVSEAIQDIHESIKEGETITAPMEGSWVFPPIVISMVDVGEQTGALPEMLMKVADDYEEEVDNAVGAMTSLIEPILIVFLAVIVGSIVIALFLPLIVIIEDIDGTNRSSQGDKAGADER